MADNKIMNFIIYTLNCNNKLITTEFINDIMLSFKINTKRRQTYKVKNIDYFITATTHKTYSLNISNEEYEKIKLEYQINNPDFKDVFIQNENYEKLEFIGDSVLKPVLTDYITSYFIDQNEGFLSKLRSRLEKTQMFSKLTRILNLKDYILISRQYEETGTRDTNLSIMEDVFEAFIGALYKDATEQKDCGYAYKIIHTLIYNIIEDECYGVDLQKLSEDDNYKDKLNAFCNSHKLPLPIYKLKNIKENVKQRGNNIYKTNIYYVIVKVQNMEIEGYGNNKKEAEQKAAENMFNKLNVK